MSDESRENYAAIYGALWEEWQANVKKARPQANNALVTGDPAGWVAASKGELAKAAREAGLVDRVGRSAERGVGNAGDSMGRARWGPDHSQNKTCATN